MTYTELDYIPMEDRITQNGNAVYFTSELGEIALPTSGVDGVIPTLEQHVDNAYLVDSILRAYVDLFGTKYVHINNIDGKFGKIVDATYNDNAFDDFMKIAKAGLHSPEKNKKLNMFWKSSIRESDFYFTLTNGNVGVGGVNQLFFRFSAEPEQPRPSSFTASEFLNVLYELQDDANSFIKLANFEVVDGTRHRYIDLMRNRANLWLTNIHNYEKPSTHNRYNPELVELAAKGFSSAVVEICHFNNYIPSSEDDFALIMELESLPYSWIDKVISGD